jgi:hypothetical protein
VIGGEQDDPEINNSRLRDRESTSETFFLLEVLLIRVELLTSTCAHVAIAATKHERIKLFLWPIRTPASS